MRQALDSVSTGPVAEGIIGGGTGMVAYEFKGGTGTASRRVRVAGEAFTLGVLVQANHGVRDWLTVLGVPVGQHFREDRIHSVETGSIIVVIGTDAPMLPHQLERLARRAGIGIGRGGTVGGNSSGDIFLAFSTANGMDTPQAGEALWSLRALNDEMFDRFYEAAVEATEEAVVNANARCRGHDEPAPAGPDRARHGPRGAVRLDADRQPLAPVMTAPSTWGLLREARYHPDAISRREHGRKCALLRIASDQERSV